MKIRKGKALMAFLSDFLKGPISWMARSDLI